MAGRMTPDKPGYWEWLKNVGRKKIISDPGELKTLFEQYVEHMAGKPIIKKEGVKGGWLAGSSFDIELTRPLTWGSFEDFVWKKTGISFGFFVA